MYVIYVKKIYNIEIILMKLAHLLLISGNSQLNDGVIWMGLTETIRTLFPNFGSSLSTGSHKSLL